MTRLDWLVTLILFVFNLSTGYSQKYPEVQNLSGELQKLKKAYSSYVEVNSLGKTLGGKDVWQVTLSRRLKEAQPAVLVVAGLDGQHVAGVQYALWLMKDILAETNRKDSPWRTFLDHYRIYIIPCASPDAILGSLSDPLYERRTNNRDTDDDRDGEVNEDTFEDLNGDGMITLMKIYRPKGKYKAAGRDSLFWAPAKFEQGDVGEFDLLPEGIDNDRDKQWNEDPPGGVNINRNFTVEYPYFEPGAGPHQISEVESRALADFAFAHPEIALVVTFTPDENVFHPWKVQQKRSDDSNGERQNNRRGRRVRKEILEVPIADSPYFSRFSELFKEQFAQTVPPPAREEKGAFARWAYFHYGRWSVALPGWVLPGDKKSETGDGNGKSERNFREGAKNADDEVKYYETFLSWADSLKWDVFVPWKVIQHPDFPDSRVEVGGFRPYVLFNPPVAQLEVYCPAYVNLLASLLEMLPGIEFRNLKVNSVRPGVYRLSFHIVNNGKLPTVSVLGDTLGWVQHVRLRFLDEGIKFLKGHRIQLLGRLEPGESREVSYLLSVASQRKLSLEIGSPTVGYTTVDIKLPRRE